MEVNGSEWKWEMYGDGMMWSQELEQSSLLFLEQMQRDLPADPVA